MFFLKVIENQIKHLKQNAQETNNVDIKALQTIPIHVHKGRIENEDDLRPDDFKHIIPRNYRFRKISVY